MSERSLIDANEASRLSGLAKATLYRLAHQGKLRSFKVLNRTLRFDRADVLALVQENGAGAVAPTGAAADSKGAR